MKMDQPEGRYHDQLMRRALEAIDASEVPLSLEALAGEMQMSTAHFKGSFPHGWVCLPSAISSICSLDRRSGC